MHPKLTLLVIATLRAGGCVEPESGQQAAVTGESAAVETLTQRQQQQRQRAIKAKDKLFQSLLAELNFSIGKKGAPGPLKFAKQKLLNWRKQSAKNTT